MTRSVEETASAAPFDERTTIYYAVTRKTNTGVDIFGLWEVSEERKANRWAEKNLEGQDWEVQPVYAAPEMRR